MEVFGHELPSPGRAPLCADCWHQMESSSKVTELRTCNMAQAHVRALIGMTLTGKVACHRFMRKEKS